MELITFFEEHKILDYLPNVIVYLMMFYFAVKILDFISGLTRTWVKREKFKSSVMREGVGRWVAEIVGLALLVMIDLFFGLNWYLTGMLLALLIYKEGGSIKENIEKLGVTLPDIVDKFLQSLGKGDYKK